MDPTIVSAAATNQWAMDFDKNTERIIETIKIAKLQHGSKIRVGSELEITGYMCEDHFVEPDTIYHSWEAIAEIIKFTRDPPFDDILCLVGLPINHRGVIYNCGAFIIGGKVILLKPKLVMCDDTVYRESRFFTSWKGGNTLMDYPLPPNIAKLCHQKTVPFGNALLRSDDGFLIGAEYCEELWCSIPSSTHLFLQGAHIVLNISGSIFYQRKLDKRMDLILSATVKTGGAYVYANFRGCDGSRCYLDGSSMIAMNGQFYALGKQNSLEEIEVISSAIDLSEVDSYRSPVCSRSLQAEESVAQTLQIISIEGWNLRVGSQVKLSRPLQSRPQSQEVQETVLTPACYLWDYLRRSQASGFFLPISGGIDSTSVLTIIMVMCHLVISELQRLEGYNLEILRNDVIRIIGRIPSSPQELMNQIMHVAYMSSDNTTQETQDRARRIAEEFGVTFRVIDIQKPVNAFLNLFSKLNPGKTPQFEVNGGTRQEDLSLQNVQARSRMVLSYLMSQLLPWHLSKPGSLLVLASSNLEEALTGYATKYDCSSADLNPIGGISKLDLRKVIQYVSDTYGYQSILEALHCEPTAELQPPKDSKISQTDEKDLGLTYEMLNKIGKLRKGDKCGPYLMFKKLVSKGEASPQEAADQVKRFFSLFATNRHKMTVTTPSIHMDSYSADDNRYDMRPILYNRNWTWQFECIDKELNRLVQ